MSPGDPITRLIVLASLGGFVYAAILNFMPRYLDEAGMRVAGDPEREPCGTI